MRKPRNNKENLLNTVTDEFIKDLLVKGHTPTEVAYILNCSVSVLYTRLRHIQDLPPNVKLVYNKRRTPQEVEELIRKAIELIRKGHTFEEVDKMLNICKGYTFYLLHKKGIKTKELIAESRKNRKFLEDIKTKQRACRLTVRK